MTVFINGIGTHTPRGSILQSDAGKLAERYCCPTPEQSRLLPVLYRRTRVRRRHSVLLDGDFSWDNVPSLYHQSVDENDRGPTTQTRMAIYRDTAAILGATACVQAIEQSSFAADTITHLITTSCTGFYAPGFDIELVAQLGLSPDVSRNHLGFMGCHAAMNAMRMAQGYVLADPSCRVLICAVETCTLHHQYGWDPQSIVANALFADGAAALIVSAEPPTDPADGLHHVASRSFIVPDTTDAMSWQIGDHGYRMTLESTVPETIRKQLGPWMSEFLDQHGLSQSDIGGWLVHPGGPRILDATSEALGLPDDALAESMSVLENYGNMSSPTVLFVLQQALKAKRPGPYVMLGFGPGLTIEAALLNQ
ncbi:type III polyketide synthase [Planctomycetes bacterium K23_9]|uniref:Alpha-pyrone synthesis polyketide synthase-like Pks18 n=1 Tax=Stieleria marina TaxID=1930275 RepID=A0A517NWN5_9BACT|nr:Alpha-pyrone synthesis polyketide synthase-like Pks18 [Planctomycetes bacterium K23_9]